MKKLYIELCVLALAFLSGYSLATFGGIHILRMMKNAGVFITSKDMLACLVGIPLVVGILAIYGTASLIDWLNKNKKKK